VVTSNLAYVETRSALARARAAGRLAAAVHRAKLREFSSFWSHVATVDVDDAVIEEAARLAERHVIRAYDAVHLSSAVQVGRAETVTFACFDEELRKAAARESLPLAPRDGDI
jgi:predicted nucleic acid-binding protein